jgi:hypothetical protein
MTTLDMFPDLKAPDPPAGIDLRCCDVAEVLAEVTGATLVVADPPWVYGQRISGSGKGADDHYECLAMADILGHLRLALACCGPSARCVVWTTHSQMPEFLSHAVRADDVTTLGGWRWVTGGTWAKVGADGAKGGRGAPGIGYHALSSESEPWLLLAGPGPHRRANVSGCRVIPRHRGRGEEHSEKPVEYQREMIRGWTEPGDLVLDLYAGLGSVARACKAEGRRYIGAEIDPARHERALAKLATYRPETL